LARSRSRTLATVASRWEVWVEVDMAVLLQGNVAVLRVRDLGSETTTRCDIIGITSIEGLRFIS